MKTLSRKILRLRKMRYEALKAHCQPNPRLLVLPEEKVAIAIEVLGLRKEKP